MTTRTLDVGCLHWVVGGDDEEPAAEPEAPAEGGNSGGDFNYDDSSSEQNRRFDFANDFGTDDSLVLHPPAAANGSIDPEQAIQSMVPPPADPLPPPTAADFDHSTLLPGPTARERFDAQVDIAQHYADTASPPEVWQDARNDCFNVASINAMAAYDPDGVASLVSPTSRGDVVQVHTIDRDGNPRDVYVNPWPLQRGGADGTDPDLLALYNGTTQLYHPGQPGGSALDAMQRLGADTYGGSPNDIIDRYRNGEGGAVLGVPAARFMTPEQQQAVEDYGLHDWHVYQVASVIHNEDDGRDYAVLRNPWGYGDGSSPHPAPIALDELPNVFGYGVIGHFPGR
jgi:hypothetical protein